MSLDEIRYQMHKQLPKHSLKHKTNDLGSLYVVPFKFVIYYIDLDLLYGSSNLISNAFKWVGKNRKVIFF